MKQVIYIANSESKNIEVWNLNKNGEMNLIQNVKTNGQVQPMQIIQSKNLLYAGISPENKIVVYTINETGCLEKKSENYISGKSNYISFDNNKNFLFSSSYHSNLISVSRLNQEGIISNPIQIIHDIKGCHAAKLNYKHNILFIMSLKEDRIYLYYLTSHGVLKHKNQSYLQNEKKSGPRHIVFHPNQDFAYTINELNGTIDVWNISQENNTIKVKNIQNIKIDEKKRLNYYWSSDIHITSCGRFLYASDRLLNIISLFHINENNTIIHFKTYKTEAQPRSFCIDYKNKHLIVAGEISNSVVVYKICTKTGELKEISKYKTGKKPIWVLAHRL